MFSGCRTYRRIKNHGAKQHITVHLDLSVASVLQRPSWARWRRCCWRRKRAAGLWRRSLCRPAAPATPTASSARTRSACAALASSRPFRPAPSFMAPARPPLCSRGHASPLHPFCMPGGVGRVGHADMRSHSLWQCTACMRCGAVHIYTVPPCFEILFWRYVACRLTESC